MTDPFAPFRADHPGRFATPERIEQLSRDRFKPWPLPKVQPRRPDAPPPIAHAGFCRNERFRTGNEPVIPGTDRSKQRNEARKASQYAASQRRYGA